jgi:hypothetical protein
MKRRLGKVRKARKTKSVAAARRLDQPQTDKPSKLTLASKIKIVEYWNELWTLDK